MNLVINSKNPKLETTRCYVPINVKQLEVQHINYQVFLPNKSKSLQNPSSHHQYTGKTNQKCVKNKTCRIQKWIQNLLIPQGINAHLQGKTNFMEKERGKTLFKDKRISNKAINILCPLGILISINQIWNKVWDIMKICTLTRFL